MKRIAVLGSTGSIGTATLAVIEQFPDRFEVVGLAAGRNLELFAEQVRRHRPRLASVARHEDAAALAASLPGTRILAGREALVEVACGAGADLVVAALVGSVGLPSILAAVTAGLDVALANKETLVVAGDLVMAAAAACGATILPVDSEHNAIHQALAVGPRNAVHRLLLTASGGPFRTWSRDRINAATRADALAHPTWKMGPKITIDSATMMNKGLEIIEAHHLFALPGERIDVLVHPQSLVHSLVEYVDGSLIAQLSVNDMRLPIQYALTWPERLAAPAGRLDLAAIGELTFEPPDQVRFPALGLARAALLAGGEMPAVLNAANEVAVAHFLAGGCSFPAITDTIAAVLEKWAQHNQPVSDLAAVLAADREARALAAERLGKYHPSDHRSEQ